MFETMLLQMINSATTSHKQRLLDSARKLGFDTGGIDDLCEGLTP
ncbi:hypothetical protein [Helicobacter canis]|nr:hypothetical protein [Helicobacter canis]